MPTRNFLDGSLSLPLVVLGTLASVTSVHAQSLGIRAFHFGSVGGTYPVDPAQPRKFSFQGGGGQTFSTTTTPSSAQYSVKGGFVQTRTRFAYKGHLTLEDFLNTEPVTIARVPVEVTFYGGLIGNIVDKQQGYVDASGDFTVYTEANPAPLIDGIPYLTQMGVKASHWLRQRLTPTQPDTAEGYPTVAFTLTNGDADGNNAVDALDLERLIYAFNSERGDAIFNETTDFNGDEACDALDLAILIANFNVQGDE